MLEHLTDNLKKRHLPAVVVLFATLVFPSAGYPWTSAHLFNVDVHVDLSRNGEATVTTHARFVVEGGYFHGFDMINLPGGKLDENAGVAILDDKRPLPVTYKRIKKDDRIRMLLDDDRFVKRGGITFQFVHKINLIETGALRPFQGRARLDWTPLVWDVGLDAMSMTVKLPGESTENPPEIDRAIAKDYVVDVRGATVNAVKYRPVKWYPMQLVVDFDDTLIDGFDHRPQSPAETVLLAAVQSANDDGGDSLPVREGILLLFIVLAGGVALVLKARHVMVASREAGAPNARFLTLNHTGFWVRAGLASFALLAGVTVQWAGFLAAGIPAMVAAAALFLFKRDDIPLKPRPGGKWREMSSTDILDLETRLVRYKRRRNSFFDISCVRGVVGLTAYVAMIASTLINIPNERPDLIWASIIDGVVLAVPTWLGAIRAELPVNPMLEGFAILKRWQKSLSKLMGKETFGSVPKFFIREDSDGPIEIRLRANPAFEGLNHIEIAGEIFRKGTIYRSRTVFVLRLVPGSQCARKLAACPGAAEHHLTPDLEEEIIVLRNRRGEHVSGITPLRSALCSLQAGVAR